MIAETILNDKKMDGGEREDKSITELKLYYSNKVKMVLTQNQTGRRCHVMICSQKSLDKWTWSHVNTLGKEMWYR